MSRYFEIRRVLLTGGEWTPLTCPIECSRITVQNGNAAAGLRMRTQVDDPDTEIPIASNYQFLIASIRGSMMAGNVIAYLSVDSGPGLAIVSFTL